MFAGRLRDFFRLLLSSGLPFAWLQLASFFGGGKFEWTAALAQWVFVISILLATRLLNERSARFIFGIALLSIAAYAATGATWVAWIGLAMFYAVAIALDFVFTNQRRAAISWFTHLLLAFIAGAAPVALVEFETHFADEEFFAAAQAGILAVFFLLLLAAALWLWRSLPAKPRIHPDLRLASIVFLLLVLAGAAITARAYQQSFFPPDAPGFQGISSAAPFLCGAIEPEAQTFDGRDVFARLLARVEANPGKGAPEYGMLALGRQDNTWAQRFRSSLLDEAKRGAFTGPANSVKFTQYDAALRVYYYSQVRLAFPDLFTDSEQSELRHWFSEINRRAVTVEWVDWMYALAFAKFPEGLYENQENGAGLLAILESTGLSDPGLAAANRNYLERSPRGWMARFRNTDDAFVYQPEWITNAFYQSLYGGTGRGENTRLAFDWMLYQALPDGASPSYNHPSTVSLAGTAYLGARLLGDARYIWLAGKAVTEAETRGRYLFAQPGIERAVDILGRAPSQGSCLLYGNSGLPNQSGPLAPDKIILRDGWSNDDAYLLLNLRFTGWHRYKATNTLTLYQNGFLAGDVLDSRPIPWVPVGRSLFRDKRIPRENLSGLLIARAGMGAVVSNLTGDSSAWAQDPPFYATVERFETNAERDVAVTRMNWRGWQQSRTVYLYHGNGPIVVLDDARGPNDQPAALAWHLATTSLLQDSRMDLRGGAQVFFLPLNQGEIRAVGSENNLSDVLYYSRVNGQLSLATVFLPGEWRGASVNLTPSAAGMKLQITRGENQISIPVLVP